MGEYGVDEGAVVEIKSLQVPGEQAQSAERAKKRRRDMHFLFKLIPLRPSRFPLQDSQTTIEIWPFGSHKELGEERVKKGRGQRTEGNSKGREATDQGQRKADREGGLLLQCCSAEP